EAEISDEGDGGGDVAAVGCDEAGEQIGPGGGARVILWGHGRIAQMENGRARAPQLEDGVAGRVTWRMQGHHRAVAQQVARARKAAGLVRLEVERGPLHRVTPGAGMVAAQAAAETG